MPAPFPKVGTISLETITVKFPSVNVEEPNPFVVVQSARGPRRASVHLIEPAEVAALFIPETELVSAEPEDPQVQCPTSDRRIDFEEGMWFLTPHITVQTVAEQLQYDADDIQSRDNSPLRSIVFVRKHAHVLTTNEVGHTALRAAKKPTYSGCDCERRAAYWCDPDHRKGWWCDCE